MKKTILALCILATMTATAQKAKKGDVPNNAYIVTNEVDAAAIAQLNSYTNKITVSLSNLVVQADALGDDKKIDFRYNVTAPNPDWVDLGELSVQHSATIKSYLYYSGGISSATDDYLNSFCGRYMEMGFKHVWFTNNLSARFIFTDTIRANTLYGDASNLSGITVGQVSGALDASATNNIVTNNTPSVAFSNVTVNCITFENGMSIKAKLNNNGTNGIIIMQPNDSNEYMIWLPPPPQ